MGSGKECPQEADGKSFRREERKAEKLCLTEAKQEQQGQALLGFLLDEVLWITRRITRRLSNRGSSDDCSKKARVA
jgi:hypothetical protein